ncbi:MAG: hypothetical protein ACD_19C00403G0002 [uncultured bacterium]|nr:MAG: hypothetical protein ACD_19C00403G0002 [uncultured bacterium]
MKLLNLNICIKISNTKEVGNFLIEQNADFVTIQEIVRHLEPGVFEEYRSKEDIEKIVGDIYPYKFFGPLWVTDVSFKNNQVHRDYGGMIEQGNEILSKHPIVSASHAFFYKSYAYIQDWTNWKQEDHGRALTSSIHDINGKRLTIFNIHGIWSEGKIDDDRTIKECEYVLEKASESNMPTIIAGDFNLYPNSPSIAILDNKFRNLIKEYGIKTTRPAFKDNNDVGLNVVDYVFVNDKVKVNDFKVLDVTVSDHLPLVLEFEI